MHVRRYMCGCMSKISCVCVCTRTCACLCSFTCVRAYTCMSLYTRVLYVFFIFFGLYLCYVCVEFVLVLECVLVLALVLMLVLVVFVVPFCLVRLVLTMLCLVRRTHAHGYEGGSSYSSESADIAERHSMSCDGAEDGISDGSHVDSYSASVSSSFLVALAASIRPILFRILCSGPVLRFQLLGATDESAPPRERRSLESSE